MATFALDTSDPFLIYPATGKQAVIANRDPDDSIVIANDAGLFNSQPSGAEGGTLTDPNVTFIDAGGFLVVDGSEPIWALAVGGTPVVSVTPGASALIAGPAVIAAAIADSGLALAIAEALAGTGIELLGGAALLYSLPTGTSIPGTLVGATIGAALNYAPYTGQGQASSNTLFNGILSRPFASTVQKIYFTQGYSPATNTNVYVNAIACFNQGASLLVSVEIGMTNSGTYANNTVTQSGLTCAQELANVITLVNNLIGSGLSFTTLKLIPWQEANGHFASATAYQNYMNFYVTGAGGLKATFPALKICYNPLVGGGNHWDGFAGAPTYATWDELYVDYYGSAYNTSYGIDGTKPNDQGSYVALAAGHTGGAAPFGIAEFNDVAGSGLGSTSYWVAYMSYVQGVFQAVLNAGNPLAWLIFWMGDHSNSKPNNQISSNSDYKVAALQAFYDAFIAQPAVVSIAGGATVTLTPLNPVPNSMGAVALATGIGYEVVCGFVAGSASTNPFMTVQVEWFPTSNVNASPVAQQWWSCPMGLFGTAGTVIYGRGPMHGGYLRVTVHNLDTVTGNITFQLNSNGRNIDRHNWLWDVGNSVNIPAYNVNGSPVTLAGNTAIAGNQVGVISGQNVAASGVNTRLFGLFSGEVFVRFFCLTGAGKMTYQLFPQPGSRWGTSAILNESPSGTEFEDIIILPRGPCVLQVTNNDTVAHSYDAEITALD